MNALRLLLAALVVATLGMAAAQATPETAQQRGQQDVTLPPGVDPEEPVAQFADAEPLTQQRFAHEFDRAMRGLAMQHGLQFTDETRAMFERFRGEFLEMFATQQALLREAEVRGIDVTDTEIDQQIAQTREAWGDRFDQTLRDLGYETEQAYRDAVREGMLAQRVVDQLRGEIQITDQQIQDFYELHRTRYFRDQPLDQVRPEVEQRFIGEQLQQRYTDLRAQHGIEVFHDRLATETGPARLN